MKRSYSCWFLVYLTQQIGIGWHTLQSVVTHNLHNVESWDRDLLSQYINHNERIEVLLTARKQFSTQHIENMLEDERRFKYRSILWNESDYPAILRECVQPPWVIYVKGRLELLHAPKIAVVGTRAPSPYGIAITKQFVKELSTMGCTIVSGLAGGIDTLAHQHSIQQIGSTIAILPCGIKHCYPSSNYKLYKHIEQEGLLLSETVEVKTVHKGLFSQRNRIIAGLSHGTIIIEGERKSGSMITAKYTMDMDRELFSIPGSLHNKKSEGPNFLIHKGYARMLMSCQQVFEDIPWLLASVKQFIHKQQNEQQNADADEALLNSVHHNIKPTIKVILSKEENIVLHHIQEHPQTVDDLMDMTGYTYEQLSVILLQLCLHNYIQIQPGSLYIAL